jgi:hypothetical protein
MSLIKMLAAPVRRVLRFPLFQLAVVVVVILVLQAASDQSILGQLFNGLDKLVTTTVNLFVSFLDVKSFTRSWLTSGFWIAYVYAACLLIYYLARMLFRAMVDRAARSNAWLRNSIARDRGIEAYRAWEPLERIRPDNVPQEKWEAAYAWPPNNEPPYPPLAKRLLREVLSYIAVALILAALLQLFTPFPALSWLVRLVRMLSGH